MRRATRTSPHRPCGARSPSATCTRCTSRVQGGGSVYKTSDGGQTWATMVMGLPQMSGGVCRHCDCPAGQPLRFTRGRIPASTSGTTPSGTWTLHGLEGSSLRPIALHPREHRRFLADDPRGRRRRDGTMYQRLPTTPLTARERRRVDMIGSRSRWFFAGVLLAQSHSARRTTAKNHRERDPIMSTRLLSRAGQGVVGSLWYMVVAPSTPARIIGEEPAVCLGSSAIARTMSPSRPWSVHVPLASVHL